MWVRFNSYGLLPVSLPPCNEKKRKEKGKKTDRGYKQYYDLFNSNTFAPSPDYYR